MSAINDNGKIIGLEVREDGVYITYQDGADPVSKKLGSVSYSDFNIANGLTQKEILVSDIPGATEIVGAGAIYRAYSGWTDLSVTYTTQKVTVKYNFDGNPGITSSGSWKVRVWWI